ncbi:MAG: hypothetical protein M1831_001599 [Alyxoria varia]|nr:MAG: hypothetical protein M1831_001599 [Alyxoria varia]
MSSFPYKKVLVLGATSGIGEALASRIISNGSKAVVVGRRRENIDSFVERHGAANASGIAFDISNIGSIPAFANQVYASHPDIDCVVLNAGIQRGFDFASPDTVDLGVFDTELTTNYTAQVHLAMALLPRLQQRAAAGDPAGLVFVTSGLGLVPMLRCGGYCATKAALHQFILVLREQIRGSGGEGGKHVKVIEVLPPAVQTELHDERHQPDIKDGRSMGMPLGQFTDETWKGLTQGDEQIPVGISAKHFQEGGFEVKRQQVFKGMMANAAVKSK